MQRLGAGAATSGFAYGTAPCCCGHAAIEHQGGCLVGAYTAERCRCRGFHRADDALAVHRAFDPEPPRECLRQMLAVHAADACRCATCGDVRELLVELGGAR